ncbi:hypothetical protein PybrP1_001934 [[Pythium] brassicae (nom. inval.)]|nr:hypothetical protein PybrP1_001934 [[Pythium] brassicae (nom. inval.)]
MRTPTSFSLTSPPYCSILDEQIWYADDSLRESVSRLIRSDLCAVSCLAGKARQLEMFVASMSSLTPAERKRVVKTSLGVLSAADKAQPVRQRSTGVRARFTYFVPFVGRVCKGSVQRCFQVSLSTVERYKPQA